MIRPSVHLYRRCAGRLLLWGAVVGGGTVVLVLWGMLGWAAQQLWTREWGYLRLQIFCDSAATSAVEALLRRTDLVADFEVISPEQGWRELQHLLGIPELGRVDTLLPVVYVVRLSPAVERDRIRRFQEEVHRLPGVHAVSVPKDRAETLLLLQRLGTVGWYGLGGVMGLLWGGLVCCVLGAIRRRVVGYRVLVLFGVMPWQLRVSLLVVAWLAAGVGIALGVGVSVGIWYAMQYVAGSFSTLADFVSQLGVERVSFWGTLWCMGNFVVAALAISLAIRRM